jgi:3-hydroxyisobutyrate dehydrogenase
MFFLLIWCLFRLGLDKNILAKLINSSTGQCWSSQIYNPCPGIVPNIPSNNDYNGGFACELMTKDLLFALGMLISPIIKLISLSL